MLEVVDAKVFEDGNIEFWPEVAVVVDGVIEDDGDEKAYEDEADAERGQEEGVGEGNQEKFKGEIDNGDGYFLVVVGECVVQQVSPHTLMTRHLEVEHKPMENVLEHRPF